MADQQPLEEELKEKELPCRKNTLAYLVSYCDIMTLCLTFFIILSTMAAEQKELAFKSGIGSFRTEVKTLGLAGILSAGRDLTEKDHLQPDAGSIMPFTDKDMTFNTDPDIMKDGYESLEGDMVKTLEKGGQVQISTGILFDKGRSRVRAQYRPDLARIKRMLRSLGGYIQVVGIVSESEGSMSKGYRIAFARAQSVFDGLGLNAERDKVSLRAYRWPEKNDSRDQARQRTVEIVVHR